MITLTPIRPRTSRAKYERTIAAVQKAYQRAAKELVADFEKTAATWEHRPRWVVRVGPGGVSVRTDDAIWGYVDKGTKPHEIRARRAKALRFASGYTAKTRPGSIIARAGGPAPGEPAFAQSVQHPGTKARGFTRRLRAKWKQRWPKIMQDELAKAQR